MGNTTKKIVIQADVVAALQGMDKVVNQLQKGLQEGTTSTDLSKGMGNNLSKLMEKFRKEYSQFTNMTKDGGLDFSRASEGLKTGKSLIQTFEELQRIMGNISTKSVVDLKKMFPEAFDSRIDGLRDSMSSLLRDLDSLASKRVTKTSLENDVTQLTTRIEALKKELVDEATLQIKSDAATQTSQKVEELGQQLDDLRKKLGEELQLKISANTRDTKKLETEAAEIQKRMQSADKNFSADGKKYKGKTQKEWENSSESGQAKAGAKRAFENRAQDSKRAKEISNQLRQLEREKEDLVAANTKYKTGGDLSKVSLGMGQSAEEIAKVTQLQVDYADAVTKSKQAAEELNAAQKGNKSTQEAIAKDTRAIEEKAEKINNLSNQIDNLEKKTSAVNIGEKFKEIAPNFDFSPELLKSEEGLRTLYAELAKIEQVQADELIKDLEGIGLNAEQAKKGVEVLRDGLNGAAEKAREISQAEKDMESLKNRMLQFFSLTNSIQLFRRAVTSAMNTVKELDATMTEAAVVTDFSVSDMWEKMPEYSTQAQKLGVAINDLYGATTLYYQQGLKTNEAMALGVETMKMAKIAAMDSTQATTAMTSALRGFNMELSETSAIRVNDVYSQLAAITAADTNQIATAMEKTASIASGANMEFESTAAFLAQIIETTQEAPETAGTALKTIIARFSEVKSLREQGLSSGEDSEGEIIDVNKIQTALRSVGISMDAYFAGTEGLDKVLMRLAEKWGTLDFETQRYIATMAAGSRQQSRFIAMMSDYGRTQELVTAANNSAGASQRQYEKTLDSLETSLTRLKNAWDEFTMGLANNEMLKTGVNLLTSLLETINKITDAVSGDNGMAKSIISLIAVIGALKGGKALVGGLTQKMSGMLGMGSYTETRTESVDENGNPVQIVSRQPYKEGKENGMAAGRGWRDGWKQAVAGAKEETGLGKIRGFGQGLFKDVVGQETVTETFLDRDALRKNIQDKMTSLEKERTAKKGSFKKVSKQQKNLKELEEQFDDTSKSTEQLAEEYKKLGGEISANNGILKNSSKQINKYKMTTDSLARGISSVGSAALGAGSALLLLGSALSAMGEEEAAEAVTTIGSYVTAIGSLAMMAPEALKGIRSMANAFDISTGAMVGWIAIAALAVAAIIKITEAVKEFGKARKLSTQIDEVNDKIADLGEAADEAKKKIESIASERENFNKLKKQFEGLTKGTKEWRQQLVNSNQEVLGLIEKYPQLSQYLATGDNGELTILEDGWDALAQQAQQQQAAAITAQTSLQIEKNKLEQQQVFEEALSNSDRAAIERERAVSDAGVKSSTVDAFTLTGSAIGAGVGLGTIGTAASIGAIAGSAVPVVGTIIGAVAGALIGVIAGAVVTEAVDAAQTQEGIERKVTGGLTQKEFSDFAVAAQQSGLYVSGENAADEGEFKKMYIEKYGSEEGWSDVWNSITEMGNKFDELGAKTEALRLAQETYMQSLLTAANQADPYLSNNKFAEQAAEGVASTYGEESAEQISKLAENYMSGPYVDKDGNPTEKLIEKYAEATGLTEDEIRGKIEAKTLSAETMAQTIATDQITEINSLRMRKIAQELTRIDVTQNKKDSAALVNLLTDEGKKLTKKDLQRLKESGLTGKELTKMNAEDAKNKINEYLETMGTSLDALGIDVQTFVDNLVHGEQQLENAYKFFDEDGYDTSNIQEKVDAATGLAFSKKIDAATAVTSEGELKEFVSEIDKMAGDMSSEDAEKFLGALSGIDWTVSEQVDGLSSTLQELGIDLSKAGIDVEELEERIKSMAKATSGLTFEEQTKQLKSLFAVGHDIKGGTGTVKLNADQKQALIDAGFDAKDFKQNPLDENEWFYQGDKSRTEVYQQLADFAQKTYDDAVKTDQESKIWGNMSTLQIAGKEQDITNEDAIIAAQEYNNALPSAFVGTWEQLYDQYGITEEEVKNSGARYVVTHHGIVAIGDFSSFKLDVPDATHESSDVGVSAQDIVSNKAIIVDKLPAPEDMEEGKKYITVEQAQQLLINSGISPDEVSGKSAAALTSMIADYAKADQSSSKGDIVDLAEAKFYNDSLSKLAAQAISTNEAFALENETIAQAMETLRVAYGLTDEEIELYQEKLKNSMFTTDEARLHAIALAGAVKDIKDKYKLAAEQIDEYLNKLKLLPENSDQYNLYIKQIGTSLFSQYGVDPGDDWIKNNLPLLQDWANGSEEAFKQVSKAMADFYLKTLVNNGAIASDQLGTISQILTEMDSQPVTTVFSADIYDYLNKLTVMTEATDAVQKYFEQEGYLISWVENEDGTSSIGAVTRIDTSSIVSAVTEERGEKWENPYDRFYNTLEKINEAMREREKLERQYQRLIKKGEASADKLTENKQKQLATLRREAELQNDIIAGREGQIANYIKEKGLGQYAYLERNEFTGQSELRINWAEINKILKTEKGQEVQEYISQLEEWFGSIEEAQDSLEEIKDTVDEIYERGKDEYLELEQTIKEALVKSYQKQIDELSNINDSINNANSKLIEAMQKSITDYRQARDNEKAEDEIADKQARLAYLQQDTSGANATEVLQLEKEIAEAQEGHIDNLIDQKISALQEQNDKAAEQRERQIDIAQAQLDQYVDSGDIWNEVGKLMEEGLDSTEGLVTGQRLEELLKDSVGFDGMSKIKQMTWLAETNGKIADALSYLQVIRGALPKVDLDTGSQHNPDLNSTSGGANDLGGKKSDASVLTLQSKLGDLYQGALDGLLGPKTIQAIKDYWNANPDRGGYGKGKTAQETLDRMEFEEEHQRRMAQEEAKKATDYSEITGASFNEHDSYRYSPHELVYAFDPKKGENRPTKQYDAQKDGNGIYWTFDKKLTSDQKGTMGTIIYKSRLYPINQFKTGGLADYTGPAWLDGTKSKPELVLNARDTQNFIQLKDILASLMTSTPKSAEKSGDMSFDIDINVETINNETDLDMIANYIENKIVSSANYRNNTIVGGHR